MEYESILEDFQTKMPQSIQIYQASDFILRLLCALWDLVKSKGSSKDWEQQALSAWF